MKGGEGWLWEGGAREGGGEEEVNPTLELARAAWARGCRAGWRAQSRGYSPRCLRNRRQPHPSVTAPRKPQRFGRTDHCLPVKPCSVPVNEKIAFIIARKEIM